MGKTWQVQEAKNKFSQVIESALTRGPQMISRHGHETAVVLSFTDYQKLTRKRTSLIDFFQKSPLRGVKVNVKRNKGLAREVRL